MPASPGRTERFAATIYIQGINPCVDVPERVSKAFGIRGKVPVRGRLNGQPIRATLVPAGGCRHRLYLNGDMRTRAGLEVGDRASIELELDRAPRQYPIPGLLAEAFERQAAARTAFERLTPSRRQEILAYLNSLKRPESLKRNVDKVVRMLLVQAMKDR